MEKKIYLRCFILKSHNFRHEMSNLDLGGVQKCVLENAQQDTISFKMFRPRNNLFFNQNLKKYDLNIFSSRFLLLPPRHDFPENSSEINWIRNKNMGSLVSHENITQFKESKLNFLQGFLERSKNNWSKLILFYCDKFRFHLR